MASELYNIIEGVSREKGIDPQIVVSAVEDAIVMATRKHYKSQENFRAKLDKDSGKINAYAVRTVVETPSRSRIRTCRLPWKTRAASIPRWKSAASC
jgi:N utilization substance protein A